MLKRIFGNTKRTFAMSCWILILIILGGLGWLLWGTYGAWAGIIVGLMFIALTLQYFLVFVPKKTMLIVMNSLAETKSKEAKLDIVLSGINFKFPWAEAKTDGQFSLEKQRVLFSEEYATKDGPKVKIKGSFVMSPSPKRGVNYYLSHTIVSDKVKDIVNGFNSKVVSGLEAVEAREKMDEISGRITKYFSKGNRATDEEKRGSATITALEKKFGIDFDEFTIADISYEDSYQKARTTKANMKVLREAVTDIRSGPGGNEMPFDEAMDNVMVVHGGNVKKTIQKVEGKTGFEALASLFMAFANASGKGNDEPQGNKKSKEKTK